MLYCVQYAAAVHSYIYADMPRVRARAHQHRVPVRRLPVNLRPPVPISPRERSHNARCVCDIDVHAHDLTPVLLSLDRAKCVPTVGFPRIHGLPIYRDAQ